MQFLLQGVAVRGGGDMAVAAGVTVAGTARLRLVEVGPGRGGLYTCLASNQEGDGESNALALQVQCEYIQHSWLRHLSHYLTRVHICHKNTLYST